LPTLGGETVWNKTYPCVGSYSNGRIVVRDYFISNAVADAKAYLAQNPITLWYELAEPIIEPLDKEYDATYPAWNYGLEQLYDTDGNLTIAQMDIEYPLDLQKQVDTNTWIAQRNEGRIAQIDASKITSGTLSSERIPDLNAEKITSGVFDAERIPHNKILYEGDHDFEDGDFETSEYDFSFEVGSTYALEIELINNTKTVIFTYTPSYGIMRLSFVSLGGLTTVATLLDVGFLNVLADRVVMDSTARIRLNYEDNSLVRDEIDRLRLKRVIKLR
ncbi:MAG TPA: hypothetical protein GX745_01995, partial [Clostridiales bacterium]|nr:hypothetical protein [Clostridiales bacterium]